MLKLGKRVEALLEERRGTAAGEALLEQRLHVHALKVLGQVRWEAWVYTRQCLLAHFHPFSFLSALPLTIGPCLCLGSFQNRSLF